MSLKDIRLPGDMPRRVMEGTVPSNTGSSGKFRTGYVLKRIILNPAVGRGGVRGSWGVQGSKMHSEGETHIMQFRYGMSKAIKTVGQQEGL